MIWALCARIYPSVFFAGDPFPPLASLHFVWLRPWRALGQIASATSPLLTIERLPDASEFYPMIRQLCIERKKKANVSAPN